MNAVPSEAGRVPGNVRRILSVVLATLITQPLPININHSKFSTGTLAPVVVPAKDLIREASKLFPGAVLSRGEVADDIPVLERWNPSKTVLTSSGTKFLGTMLHSNPDGSFTLPPKRRVMGIPREPEDKDGLYRVGRNWHGRPTKVFKERIVDNYKGEIAMTPDLSAAIFRIVKKLDERVQSGDLTTQQWEIIIQSSAFHKMVQREAEVIGKTLEQVLYIVEQLGNRLFEKKLKINSKNPRDPYRYSAVFGEVFDVFLGPDQVIVESIAAGLNSNGNWAATGFPVSIVGNDFHVLGSDLYGRVVAVGSNVAQIPVDQGGFRVGDMVVFQTGLHEKNDPRAHGGHPGRTESFHITGYETPDGTFTDFYKNEALAFMRVSEEDVVKRVQVLDSIEEGEPVVRTGAYVEEMASYGLVLPTVEHAMARLGIREQNILIMEGGNGGTGRFGIQAAKARKAFVIAIVSTEQKGKEVMALGADAYINRKDSKLVKIADVIDSAKWIIENEFDLPERRHSMTPNFSTSDLKELRNKLEGWLNLMKGDASSEKILKHLAKLETLLGASPAFYKDLKRLGAIKTLIEIEKGDPGFLNRAYRVKMGSATWEDMEVVNRDYLKAIKEAVQKIKKENGLKRPRKNLAHAVINFMGTETYGRHALSVREGDPLNPEDLGGVTASFGGGSGFKVQFPGAAGETDVKAMIKRIQKYRPRAGTGEHIKKAVVMGSTKEAREEVEELLSKSQGGISPTEVLVVVRNQEEADEVAGWDLLRKGKDGIVNAGAKQSVISEGSLEEKIEQLKAIAELPFQRHPATIVVETNKEKLAVQKSGYFRKGLDVIYSREEHYVVTDIKEVEPEAMAEERKRDHQKRKKNFVFLVQSASEKKRVVGWYAKNDLLKLFNPKRDLFLEPYLTMVDFESPMPETPTPFPYDPTRDQLKTHIKKNRALGEWLNGGPKGLGRALWSHWGKGVSPDLIFGRADWENWMPHWIFVLKKMGQLAIRENMDGKIYNFDIRHFWMFQKVILGPTRSMIGTHYASVAETLRSHNLVREGVIKLAPVQTYSFHDLGLAQEKLGRGKNVILIGSPGAGLSTIDEIHKANEERFTDVKHLIRLMQSPAFEEREFAAAQLHFMSDQLSDQAYGTLPEEVRSLLFKPATCGICVEKETFEKILSVWGGPLVHVIEKENAREFELHLPGGIHVDVLTPIDRGKDSALVKYLNRSGEGIQQVEIFSNDIEEVTKLLKLKPTRDGATGQPVNFQLVELPNGEKVLVEYVQATEEQLQALPKQEIVFAEDWLDQFKSSFDSSV